MSKKFEIRTLVNAQIRSTRARTLEGYAACFNLLSSPLPGGFLERIQPGAFSRAIKSRQDVRALLNHDPNLILGRTKSGTLKIWEDTTGLAFSCNLPDTQVGRDVHSSVARGDIDGCSFSFAMRAEDWNEDGTERTLIDVDLFDISPATFPAYEGTQLQARSTAQGEDLRAGLYTMKRDSPSGLHVPTQAADDEGENLRRVARARLAGIEIEQG
jgi:HK97 family phage prohead protease